MDDHPRHQDHPNGGASGPALAYQDRSNGTGGSSNSNDNTGNFGNGNGSGNRSTDNRTTNGNLTNGDLNVNNRETTEGTRRIRTANVNGRGNRTDRITREPIIRDEPELEVDDEYAARVPQASAAVRAAQTPAVRHMVQGYQAFAIDHGALTAGTTRQSRAAAQEPTINSALSPFAPRAARTQNGIGASTSPGATTQSLAESPDLSQLSADSDDEYVPGARRGPSRAASSTQNAPNSTTVNISFGRTTAIDLWNCPHCHIDNEGIEVFCQNPTCGLQRPGGHAEPR